MWLWRVVHGVRRARSKQGVCQSFRGFDEEDIIIAKNRFCGIVSALTRRYPGQSEVLNILGVVVYPSSHVNTVLTVITLHIFN